MTTSPEPLRVIRLGRVMLKVRRLSRPMCFPSFESGSALSPGREVISAKILLDTVHSDVTILTILRKSVGLLLVPFASTMTGSELSPIY